MGSLKKQIKRLVQKESFAYRCLLFLYRIFSQCTKFIHDNLVYCFIIKGIIRDIQQNLDANKHLSSEGGGGWPRRIIKMSYGSAGSRGWNRPLNSCRHASRGSARSRSIVSS